MTDGATAASTRVDRLTADDGARLRAVRLRALADTPDAFGRLLSDEEALSDGQWRQRLERTDAATFVAVGTGGDVGLVTMLATSDEERTGLLVSMWVAPEARRCGHARALVDAATSWARAQGLRRVVLDVADENHAATAFYERCGFRPTGRTGSLPPPREHVTEHERALDLSPGHGADDRPDP